MIVGVGELLERGVGLDAEEPVLRADHAAVVADERDVEVGDPLEHLVRPDAVERREAGKEWNGDLHGGPFMC